MDTPVPVAGPRAPGLPPDAGMRSTIRSSTARRPEDVPLARVFAPRTEQRWGRGTPRPLRIHDGHGRQAAVLRPPGRCGHHDVHAADGTVLARITRRPGRLLTWPRRVRWSARLATAAHPVTGREGTWYVCLTYGVTAPSWFPHALRATLYALIDGTTDDPAFSRPVRAHRRAQGTGTVLDHRGVSEVHRLDPRHLDARVAYALAVLQIREGGGRSVTPLRRALRRPPVTTCPAPPARSTPS
ncbi:hypothetical protein ACIBBD_31745 [Streptomyces sp. NPDC051315]|uniref:hypothetical protein n=1 Tax=Streptomyces sp. NPDC051315 TaxID=3365650 RepID=UPI0037AA38C6